jgi:transcriptional regulator with XRE-family HTH domain
MNRRDKSRMPRPGMLWSEKHKMWVDPDTRTPQVKVEHEAIAKRLDSESERISEALESARKAQDHQTLAISEAASGLASRVIQALVDIRKLKGLTQIEISDRMGIQQSALVRLENQSHSPTLWTLSRYAVALGVGLFVDESGHAFIRGAATETGFNAPNLERIVALRAESNVRVRSADANLGVTPSPAAVWRSNIRIFLGVRSDNATVGEPVLAAPYQFSGKN